MNLYSKKDGRQKMKVKSSHFGKNNNIENPTLGNTEVIGRILSVGSCFYNMGNMCWDASSIPSSWCGSVGPERSMVVSCKSSVRQSVFMEYPAKGLLYSCYSCSDSVIDHFPDLERFHPWMPLSVEENRDGTSKMDPLGTPLVTGLHRT